MIGKAHPGFAWSLARTGLIGFALLSALMELGEALSFSDGAYFLGLLVVLVLAALSDRADPYNARRRAVGPDDEPARRPAAARPRG